MRATGSLKLGTADTEIMSTVVTSAELPGDRATRDHLRVLCNRYLLAQELCEGKEVLEAACGAGLGLGLIARRARKVVGGDIDEGSLRVAQATYRDRPRVFLGRMDAERMPFADSAFDVVIMFEAIYLLADAAAFVREAHRVLRPEGLLLIASANSACPGFYTFPGSRRYYDGPELAALLASGGFAAEIYAGFPDHVSGAVPRTVEALRRLAVRLGLLSWRTKGKTLLKRLAYGRLETIPPEITPATAQPEPLVEMSKVANPAQYRIIYAIGRKIAGVADPA